MWPRNIAEIAQILGTAVPSHFTRQATGASDTRVQALSTDSRRISAGEIFVAIRGETHDGHTFVEGALRAGASAAVVEDAWLAQNSHLSDRCLSVRDTTQAMRTLAKSFRTDFSFPVFAVGGSNGKTTTKEMLSCLLSTPGKTITRTHKSENGFLGLAMTLTQKKHNVENPPDALVAEIGIDDVGAMSEHIAIATPDIAMLTALGPEHLAGLGSWEKAIEEELILFRHSTPTCRRIWQLCEPQLMAVQSEVRPADVVVFNSDDRAQLSPVLLDHIAQCRVASLEFSILKQSATQTSLSVHWQPLHSHSSQSHWNSTFDVLLPGIHNAQNFVLALAAAASTGHGHDELARTWQSFTPPEMRSRIVHLSSGITLYDDCYNASPASMDAAFEALLSGDWKSRHKVIILGDMLDLGEESKSWHLKLVDKLLKIEKSDLCLFGTAMYDVFKEIKNNHSRELQSGNIQLQHADPAASPAQILSEMRARLPGSVVLIKGSRGMDLGRFVKLCEDWFPAQG